MINKINHIYYINLDNRYNRRRSMEEQLLSLGFPYTRIPGVDCVKFIDYPIPDYIEKGSPRHKGTVGCFLAHKQCLEYIYSNNADHQNNNSLILEDDSKISNGLIDELESIELPKDCDILFINSIGHNKNRLKFPYPDKSYFISSNMCKIYTIYPYFVGAHCYVVNDKKLSSLLNKINNTKIYEDYDMFLFKRFNCYTYISSNFDLKWYKSDRDPGLNYGKITGMDG